MLYLVKPDWSMDWIDLPTKLIKEAIATQDLDLRGLSWEKAERRVDITTLRLALRHGIAFPTGIAVDAGLVGVGSRGAEIRASHARVVEAQAKLEGQDQFMEAVAPGWRAHGEKLNQEVAESSERAAVKADEDLARELAPEPNPELVAHWLRLGGVSPGSL